MKRTIYTCDDCGNTFHPFQVRTFIMERFRETKRTLDLCTDCAVKAHPKGVEGRFDEMLERWRLDAISGSQKCIDAVNR